jgi:TetR/AcrR family transcriptional regulator, regulator of cefoperazone and chloramphenicol sensitivity
MLKDILNNLCSSDLREQRGAATRQRLVSAAVSLFGERGFKAVSVREIADSAKTNVAAISYHFRDKQGLYREAFNVPVQPLLAAMAHLGRSELSFEEFSRTLYRSLLAALMEDERLARQMMKMHHREMIEPSGMLASFVKDFATPIHRVVLDRLHLEIDPRSLAAQQRADASIQAIAFMMFGLAMDFYLQSDFVEAFAPELLRGQKAIDALVESLTRAACAIVASEKSRRTQNVNRPPL